jgi:hypothetical protein
VGALGLGNGFDDPVNLSIVHRLPQGGGNMNRIAGLNLRYQSLRSTIRQEQIQLTHLRKLDSKHFIRGSAGTTSAKNAACKEIRTGWPIVPMAKGLSLGARKGLNSYYASVCSRPNCISNSAFRFYRIGSKFFGSCKPIQKPLSANSHQLGDPGNLRTPDL